MDFQVRISGDPDVPSEIVGRDQLDGWSVEARWDMSIKSRGPSSMTVTLAPDASPDVRARGLSSGALRRIEKEVVAGTDEWHATSTDDGGYQRKLQRLVRDLPNGPRSPTGDYYGQLLKLFDVLDGTQREPMNDLVALLKADGRSVTKNTLKSQLQRARARKEESKNG